VGGAQPKTTTSKDMTEMPWTSTGSVAVVVAQQFNPSAVTQLWLMNRGVVRAEEFVEGGDLFTGMIVQVRTTRFQLLLLQEQLQFVPLVPPEEQQAVLKERLGTLIDGLSYTPYKALGLNFTWQLAPAHRDVKRLTRELFRVPDSPLHREFGDDGVWYGGYLSKDFAGFRLKLDIKPVTLPSPTGEHRLQFAFNFHCDLEGAESGRRIHERLSQWDQVRAESEHILDTVEPRQT